MKLKILIFLFIASGISGVYSKNINVKKDIRYISDDQRTTRNLLDVYYPKITDLKKNVLVFIHGGSWNSGKKETYWWLGKNMANKNVVTVIINYSLSPEYQYETMANDCAASLKWVRDSISTYGGRSDRIFVMGHSAGGHLASLINSDPRFFEQQGIPNPIFGLILNDGFGLDMYDFLSEAAENRQNDSFMVTFSKDKESWKAGSPINYLNNIQNPYLIFVGEHTYPAIKLQSQRFFDELSRANKLVEIKFIKRKKHVGMISHMIFPGNQMYGLILDFIERKSNLN
jgi:acetyl esterase/lipase